MDKPPQNTVPPAPPARPDDAHKGTFGTVIVVGGCETMIGAPALCAAAALRTGAGLVKIATWPGVLPYAITIEPGATGIELEDDATANVDRIDAADAKGSAVLAVGPGIGQSDRARMLVTALLQSDRPTVLDADGLNLLAAMDQIAINTDRPLVLTPHPGEFERLAAAVAVALPINAKPENDNERIDAAARLADAYHCVVLLKGARTVVAEQSRVYVNETGNPSMATAGSGDVLTGAVAALMAQGMTAFDAAALGAHVHGQAGDLWSQKHGKAGLTAIALANGLPDAINATRHQAT
ncbi:MAG: NAD(P)H-hydrate dehydratase [Phycisphaeraceae bacterium]|jgi:NAD(P)H-hydrate epimerase|nr:NAD(P)H-hydrate dehydratase [Phycisphaeraceae bacterium]MDP7348260.1 NAD(P)H-hydrate dehydratase [Phycisphaeraceae bacterium]